MPISETATRIFTEIQRSLELLGCRPTIDELNGTASLVTQSMSSECRTFHRGEHALDLIDPKDAILTLSALFHDVVYYQVDGHMPEGMTEFLKPLIDYRDGDLFLVKDLLVRQPDLALPCQIFGTGPGQKLNPFNGLNEFLSAVAVFMTLRPMLADSILVQIYACIEATIPFRPVTAEFDSMRALEKNLRLSSKKFNLGLDQATIDQAMTRAAELSNRDVGNFASNNPSWFLATTWLLLPERNARLRGNLFTVKDYRQSLYKMSEFFDFLKPEIIFKTYHGAPDTAAHTERVATAKENIAIARVYIKVKLVALGLLEAMAHATGGDLHMPKFLGGKPAQLTTGLRMEDHLPKADVKQTRNPKVYEILKIGRALDTNFDLRNSPLATFIYEQMTDPELESLLHFSREFFNDKMSYDDYLAKFPPLILNTVAEACSQSCPERAAALRALPKKILGNQAA